MAQGAATIINQGRLYSAQLTVPGAPGGAIATGEATVGLAAIKLREKGVARRSVIIYNAGPGRLYVGNSDVTVDNAPPLFPPDETTTPPTPGGDVTLDRNSGDVYVVSDTVDTDVRFLEEINDWPVH